MNIYPTLKKITLSAIALGLLASNPAFSAVTLKLAHYAEPGHPADVAANQMAKNVKERTGGEVKINVYPANQLGSPNDVLEQNVLGVIDMSLPTQGHLSKYSLKFATVMTPFAFRDAKHAYDVLDGPFIEWAAPDLEQHNLIYLSNWDWGFRNITNNKKAINHASDVEGLKLRTPPEVQLQSAMSALGANVAQLSFNELYMALKQGVVDGQENPLSVIYYNKLYEVQNNLAMTEHVYNSMVNVISKKKWDKLTPEQQVILKEESIKAGNMMRETMQKEQVELVKMLEEKGMKVTRPNKAEFKAAMGPAYTKIGQYAGEENLQTFLDMLN
ncbi:TRAP transporter substrate-binding protein [Vibrio sp. DW001]|uniref:TRAP transporter substrate-binding protein n=1 Tax=Vibrio sp. DW001 TaxID=2912315 RepID=UPI0023B0E25E|nr:TRAP transporter substrate-binding protein [Vibrio sp. DW001]WED26831.1 TRAP transporter substrate-binding protein [Vibrio sp. DW001]